MRLALSGVTLAAVAFAALTPVVYLNAGGYSADWPEYRRIAVSSAEDCAQILDRAERTLGAQHGMACERIPRWRHMVNLVRAAYERDGATGVGSLAFGGEAQASAAHVR
jgi:hypothetical protein